MNDESVKGTRHFMAKLGFTLFLITSITALLLAGVNSITSEPIAQRKIDARNQAMQAVMPGSTLMDDRTIKSDASTVYTVKKSDGTYGYCVEVAPSGFGGPINMIVGVDLISKDSATTGTSVTGVAIVSMKETAGLGTRAKNSDFLSQYIGKVYNYLLDDSTSNNAPSSIKVGSEEGDIDAIAGATITSKAVTEGVNMALDAVRAVPAGEGASK